MGRAVDMRRSLVALFGFLLFAGWASAAVPEWTAGKGAPIAGASDIDHSTWSSTRSPGGPFDRIEVHRYRTKSAPVATLLYLPGTNMNGEVAVTDEDHNLWIFLARRGVEVFALDYRTRFASSSTDATALASMKAWTTEAFVDDIKAAAALARAESGEVAAVRGRILPGRLPGLRLRVQRTGGGGGARRSRRCSSSPTRRRTSTSPTPISRSSKRGRAGPPTSRDVWAGRDVRN